MNENIFATRVFPQTKVKLNFAKGGFHSVHNTGYWQQRPHIGLGPSAYGLFEGRRSRNVANLKKYLEAINNNQLATDFSEKLDPKEHQIESLIIALRLLEGVDLTSFKKRFGGFSKTTELSLQKLEKENLITQKNSYLKLTEKGILFHDYIATELI